MRAKRKSKWKQISVLATEESLETLRRLVERARARLGFNVSQADIVRIALLKLDESDYPQVEEQRAIVVPGLAAIPELHQPKGGVAR